MKDIGINYEKFFANGRNREDNGAVVLFTDNQVVERVNSNGGRGDHLTNFYKMAEYICFGDELATERLREENFSKYLEVVSARDAFCSGHIHLRLVAEKGYYHIAVILPKDNKITEKEFVIFSNWCNENAQLIKGILEQFAIHLNEPERKFILYGMMGKYFLTNDFFEVLDFAKNLIDNHKDKLIQDINIVGKTYNHLLFPSLRVR